MLIIAALSIEIAPLLNTFKAEKIKAYSNKTALYKGGDHYMLITGVGPVMAERTLNSCLRDQQPERILNIGTAGILDTNTQLGKTYHIATAVTENEAPIALDLMTGQQGVTCLSVRRSIEDPDYRDRVSQTYHADLADMECYTIAAIAKSRGIPMSGIKVTTDYADCETKEMFEKQVNKSVKILTKEVLDVLNTAKETS